MNQTQLATTWRHDVFNRQEDLMRNKHLDHRIRLSSPDDYHLAHVLDPLKVAHHQFYPFIEFTDVTRRYKKKDKKTRVIQNKPRELCYAAHQDVLVYSWYGRLLGQIYESYVARQAFGPSVLAYRHIPLGDDFNQGRSNIHFATEVFGAIRDMGECTVLTFDVEHFFPSIDHMQLKEMWCALLNADQLPEDHYAVFRSLTRYATVRSDDLLARFGTDVGKTTRRYTGQRKSCICTASEFREFKDTALSGSRKAIVVNEKASGIPQGSTMSGLLSNIFMMDFDQAIHTEVSRRGGRYWRYSDDIAIVLPVGQDPELMDKFVRAESENKKLTLHGAEKSATIVFSRTPEGVASVTKALDYLGFSYDGASILLRDKTVSRFYRRMSTQVRAEVARARKYKTRVNIKKLYREFTHLGLRSDKRRNFLSYAKKASAVTGSRKIAGQVSRAALILQRKLKKRMIKKRMAS